jgi:hypothetical protein
VLNALVFGALVVGLAGVGYGAFHHARFIKAGGQRGFRVTPVDGLSNSARASYRAMLMGYGAFLGGVALALLISTI